MNQDFNVDLEKGTRDESEEASRKSPEKKHFLNQIYDRFEEEDKQILIEEGTLSSPDSKTLVSPDKASPCRKTMPECGKMSAEKERRKKSSSLSNKKAPKPPRPPQGPSVLDAADQKLIREITELAMLKRARVERMKALKKTKAGKAAASSSSQGNVLATVFTLLFCVVIIFQGMSPREAGGSSRKSLLSAAGVANDDLVSVQSVGKPSAVDPNGAHTGPDVQNLVKWASGRDTEEKTKKVAR